MSLTTDPQAPRKLPVADPKHRITAKVRAAIEAMVWDGLPRRDAAAKAGISEHGLYKALRSPPVKAAYLHELDVLRTSERARNIHRLTEIRDAANNMPAVQAIRALELIEEEQRARGNAQQQAPGLVVIVQGTAVVGQQRDNAANPLIEHAARVSSPPHEGE